MGKQEIINELEDWTNRKNQLSNFKTLVMSVTIPRDFELNIHREIGREIEICEAEIQQISNDLPLIN